MLIVKANVCAEMEFKSFKYYPLSTILNFVLSRFTHSTLYMFLTSLTRSTCITVDYGKQYFLGLRYYTIALRWAGLRNGENVQIVDGNILDDVECVDGNKILRVRVTCEEMEMRERWAISCYHI